MALHVNKINTKILLQCRTQIGLNLAEVGKKVPAISAIETGKKPPTLRQLNTLSELYNVPRWVFISDHLPEKYQFRKSVPAFRQFAHSNGELFSNYKVRSLTAKVDQLRNLILELRDDMGEPILPFTPPQIQENADPNSTANRVRAWLRTDDNLEFHQWKEKLENKGIFIFLTSKYKGWSHIDKAVFRGLAIHHKSLPIIIINDSDSKKAQSFSLFHELGHLLRGESAIDDWSDQQIKIEKWCDALAGNILMPAKIFRALTMTNKINDLNNIKKIAKTFKVSSYSSLVRLRQLRLIDQSKYLDLENQLNHEYKALQKKLKESKGGPARNRPKEVLNQYGSIYARALFQTYYNQDIGLDKLGRAFDLKRTAHVLEIGKQL